MLNNSAVSLYDNFGLIFKSSEDKATNDIKIGRFRPHTVNRRLASYADALWLDILK